jgi:hypothetical protein
MHHWTDGGSDGCPALGSGGCVLPAHPRLRGFSLKGWCAMPVRKVKGGYRWGSKGKTYKTKAGAQRQARAAYANGYKGKGK